MQKIFTILLLIVVVTMCLVAVILTPDGLTSFSFVLTLGWLIILALINWFAGIYYFGKIDSGEQHSSKLLGILPSVGIMVFSYSFISASLAISNFYFNPSFGNGFFENYHLLIQVSITSIFFIIVLSIVLASKVALSGGEELPKREDLVKLLQKASFKIDETYQIKFNELVDFIKYKMPHPSRMVREDYLELVSDIESLSLRDKEPLASWDDDVSKILNKVSLL